jgi:hypothetical protein
VKKFALLAILAMVGFVAANAATTTNYFVKGNDHVSGTPYNGNRVGGENIATAVVIGALPFSDTGNTCGFLNDYDEVCPYSGSMSGDCVYAYSPAADGTIDIDLCNSTYDTKVFVYQDVHTPGAPWACNDDAGCGYSGWQSRIEAMPVFAGSTYYIVIDGYGSACGDYILDILPGAGPCVLDCPAGALLEGEEDCYDNYVDAFNGGCNSFPNVFSVLNGNDGSAFDVCGTSGTYSYLGLSYRDTDWYELTVTVPGMITFDCVCEFDGLIFMIDGNGGCGGYVIINSMTGGPCDVFSLSNYFNPGTYWFWVGPSVFSGIPCGADYIMTITGYIGEPTANETTTWGSIKSMFK